MAAMMVLPKSGWRRHAEAETTRFVPARPEVEARAQAASGNHFPAPD